MVEVRVSLRFNNHSLGGRRFEKRSRMLRDPDGKVMFLPTWWNALMCFAANLANRHQALVKKIDWDPVIEGSTKLYRRFYAQGKYTIHEAFCPGDIILVHAVLPTDLPIDDFKQLLDIAGRYKGMSPFRPDKKWGTFNVVAVDPSDSYGTFDVLSVKRRKRKWRD